MLNRKPKPKKTPVKGEPIKKQKETICSKCGKNRPYGNKTKKLCQYCVKKVASEKAKERKAKARKKKAETITQAKLDQVTSWLVRALHEEKCHACQKELPKLKLQCCHFVSRTKTTTRFDLHNMLPGCQVCNMYTPHHVWELGKSINRKWGEEKTEELLSLAGKQLKLTNNDRKEIYTLYRGALDKVQAVEYTLNERMEILDEVHSAYLDIVEKLIK